jgi:hypothetical protein
MTFNKYGELADFQYSSATTGNLACYPSQIFQRQSALQVAFGMVVL